MNTCNPGTTFLTAVQAKQMARNSTVIWNEICAIQQEILSAISGCTSVNSTCVNTGGDFCVTITGGTPMTWVSNVESVTVDTPGAGYVPVVAEAAIYHPVGSGGTATVTVTSGLVIQYLMTAFGTDYQPVYATGDLSLLAGTGGIVTFGVDTDTGAITDVDIVNGGAGYALNDVIGVKYTNGAIDVDLSAPPGPNPNPDGYTSGTGANIQITAVDSLSGAITEVTIISGGLDYQTVVVEPVVLHPVGSGFQGYGVVDGTGQLTSVLIQDSGILYSPLGPTIVFQDIVGSNGSGAEGTVVYNESSLGEVNSVTVTEGGANYSEGTTGTIVSADDIDGNPVGSGATVTVTVNTNIYNTDPYLYYRVLIGDLDDCGIEDQMEQVELYFSQLGYQIEAQVNSSTGGSIQWQVCWC